MYDFNISDQDIYLNLRITMKVRKNYSPIARIQANG